MSTARHHAEWLSLIEVSGPFLSMPVLMRVFPQGMIVHDPEIHRNLRQAHEEWEDSLESRHPDRALHRAWVEFILKTVLEFKDEVIATGQAIQQTWQTDVREHDEILRPDLVIKTPAGRPDAGNARLFVQIYPANQDLQKPVAGKSWKASPDTRMAELLRGTGIRLGLVTNGHRWMLVDAPRSQTTGFISWYANLWLEEPITLKAFRSLLSMERFFGVADKDTLESMLAESAQNQQEVTDQLGYQVRRAVGVLIQSLDQADQDHGRELLGSVAEAELYEAALTVMMRLVFLFCAEERGLLLLGDPLFDQHYAVSTLRAQLREAADQHGEEVLERRHDAWCRLLSTFRAVYGGVEHERMTLPAYGGNLFDPDRFPFLEGRMKATTWREVPCDPLPVNNRTVLHLLEALQTLQVKLPGGGPAESRRLSFRALDIEQIGYVYEGLLDHTAKRATEPVLGFVGAKNQEPEIALAELEKHCGDSAEAKNKLLAYLKDETGKAEKALGTLLATELFPEEISQFQAACGNDDKLWKRVKPFASLIRNDDFGHPVVICKNSFYVTGGTDRRSSGTHFTPTIMTEPIVRHAMEPLVYIGPAEGKPKEEWKLRTPAELLELKICDKACGCGTFLVQVDRYLAERLVEAWEIAEKNHPDVPGITPEGTASTGKSGENLIPKDSDERMIFARRIVAQRCLYGVDKNPLAAEMAKLSLWLLTLQKDKPFTFLDHAIRSGDSLVGIANTHQLTSFSLDGEGIDMPMFTKAIKERLDAVRLVRRQISELPDNSAEDVQQKALMLRNAEEQTKRLTYAANCLLVACWESTSETDREERLKQALLQVENKFIDLPVEQLEAEGKQQLQKAGCPKPFHWPLEFPEVFMERGGFDGIVGNPPFMHGSWISSRFGDCYAAFVRVQFPAIVGKVDFVVYFLHRAAQLAKEDGALGLILTAKANQGDARKSGFQYLLGSGYSLYSAHSDLIWPGDANVLVCMVHVYRGAWQGKTFDSHLRPMVAGHDAEAQPLSLLENEETVYLGAKPDSLGFVLSVEHGEHLTRTPQYRTVVRGYYSGTDLNDLAVLSPPRFIIDFSGYSLEQAKQYPELLQIIEREVKPKRITLKRAAYSERWWQFTEPQLALFRSIRQHEQVLAVGRISKFFTFRFVPTSAVYSDKVVVFVRHSTFDLAVLSSAIHSVWALEWGTTHGGGTPNYKPTESARTFPFPHSIGTRKQDIDSLGTKFDAFRNEVMQHRQIGPTLLYNRFHDPDETSDDVQKLRDLHVEIDNAVAAAYGWTDLDLDHGFHKTKQGLRFTIRESARCEVLSRLLKLNHKRYAEEVAQGLHDKKKSGGKAQAAGGKEAAQGPSLFD